MYKPIIKLLESHGYEAYVGGETARDIYRKVTPKVNKIIVNGLFLPLKNTLKDQIISVDPYTSTFKVKYREIIYIICPLKTVAINNTYCSFKPTKSFEEHANHTGFTINSLYYNPINDSWINLNNAKKDIDNKIIRFVGNAEDRILESKIRLLEGPVLIGTLGEGWSLDKETHDAIKKYHLKIVMAHSTHINREMNNLFKYVDTPSKVFNVLKSTKLIDEILPEFMLCNNIEQTNKKKGLTLQQHIMYALDSVTLKQTNHIELRLAALLHDIAKPHCYIETKTGMHFYNHENIGAILAERILYRWGYKKEIAKKVALLVKHHLFNASFRVSDSQISKLIAKVGPENIHDLLDLRIADRRGTGRKDISMKAVEQMRVRVNNALSTISPKTFKLALSNSELEKAIRFSTDNAKSAASDIKEYLKHKVLYGRLSNKPANLKRAIREINRIKCPLDKSHLFKTWSNIVKGSEEVFEDGKLKCGVYCEFICDKKRNK